MSSRESIKGVNLGSWLLMEGYILGGRNIAEQCFKRDFAKIYGQKELRNFEASFRDNFIAEVDFRNIADLGAKVIRLPFNYRLIESKPYHYSQKGFSYLDKAFSWAKKHKLKIILDLHAAAGSQNCDWHADSSGKALLWDSQSYQSRTFCLWQAVAERFKNNPALAGYDLLNEPVLGKRKVGILKNFYQKAIKAIREVDKTHTIYLEGNNWAQDIDFLADLIKDKIAISIHAYLPLNYTFNFDRFCKFPGRIEGVIWDKKRIYKYLEPYYKFSRKNKVKIFVGEFGINWRGGFFGELGWLKAILDAFESFNFQYTYWTYKAVSQSTFPDGIYQYRDNSPYINREGPVFGWETYLNYWKKDKPRIVNFWQTKSCQANRGIIKVLKKYFKR